MQSTCPNCKKQIEHEDFLFEVACDCGSRFNPFMNASDDAAFEPVEAPATDYSESASVFSELKNFAEQDGVLPEIPSAQVEEAPSTLPRQPPRPPVSGQLILTAGDSIPGYQIESYLAPVSASVPLAAHESNPLGPAFDALSEQASAVSASGIVAVRWVLSPTGTHVVLSGTPVICSKAAV
jgi:uncharacterized protein YbjQ (UPF0145 family)